MIRVLVASVLSGILVGSAGAAKVKELNAVNFQKSVLDSSDVWLIEMGSPSTFILEENMEDLPTKLIDYGVKVGNMDCDDQNNLKICKLYGYRGTYALNGFFEAPQMNPYTKKNFRGFVPFSGKTTPKGIEKFIAKGCPSEIVIPKTIDDIDKLVFGAGKNVAILFSNKEKTSVYYKTIAIKFKKSLPFIQISEDGPSSDFLQKFPEFESFPSLGVYSEGSIVMFEGDLNDRSELIDWLSEYSVEQDVPDTDADGKSSQDTPNAIRAPDLFSENGAHIVAVVKSNAKSEIPEWTKYVEFESAARISELQCSSGDKLHGEYFTALCSDEAKLPYVLTIPFDVKEKKKVVSQLSKWSYSIDKFELAVKKISDSLPDLVAVLHGPDKINEFLVDGVKSNRISVIVFSDKSTAPVSLKTLAASDFKFCQVGFVPEPTDAVLGNFGWSRSKGVPVAIGTFYSDGEQEKQKTDVNWEEGPDASKGKEVGFRVMYYDAEMFGPMKFNSLRIFAGSIYQRSGLAAKSRGASNQEETRGPKLQETLIQLNSEADWSTECGETQAGICVIGFLPSPSNASPSQAYDLDSAAVTTLTDAMKIIQKETPAFKFFSASVACLSQFAALFDVDPFNVPTIAIYSPSKGRKAVLRGSFSSSSIKTFLDGILRGSSPTVAVTSRPHILAEVDCKIAPEISESTVDAVGDSDAEDFLAEIRREEEERAAQLKKEIEEEKRKLAEESKSPKKAAKKKVVKKKKSEL